MAIFTGWLKATRVLGAFAIVFGLLGTASYSITPDIVWGTERAFLRSPESGLFLCGLLALGGLALFAASHAARKDSRASLANLGACCAMVVALVATTSGELAPRVWIQTVLLFS